MFLSSLRTKTFYCKILAFEFLHFLFCVKSIKHIRSVSSYFTPFPILMLLLLYCTLVPSQYNDRLYEYSSRGYRVMAMAYRSIDNQSILAATKIQRFVRSFLRFI